MRMCERWYSYFNVSCSLTNDPAANFLHFPYPCREHMFLTCLLADQITIGQLRYITVYTLHCDCISRGHLWLDFIHHFRWRKTITYIYYVSHLLHLFSGRNVPQYSYTCMDSFTSFNHAETEMRKWLKL